MTKTFPVILSMVLALPAVVTSQGASFTEFGQGCPSALNNTCPNSNPGAMALAPVLRTSNPRLAIEVIANTPAIDGFELFTRAATKRSIKAWVLLPDANGNPDDANPAATGTLDADTTLGWYQAKFSQLVIVGPGTRYFLSWEEGPGLGPLIADPSPQQGLFGNYLERQVVSGQPTWVKPPALRRWAWKIDCQVGSQTPRTTSATQPSLGNANFSLLLVRAPGMRGVVSVLGDSKQIWGSVSLPLDLTPVGAAGCSLLVSPLVVTGAMTDQYGQASLALPIPNNTSLRGATFHGQWAVVDPQANALGVVFSNGGTVVVGDAE